MKLPNGIEIEFVEPHNMRYDTTDDYVWKDGKLFVSIVDRENKLDRMAILIHALVEFAVAEDAGVIVQQIDDWDFSHLSSEEPGEEPGCPYGKAHGIAVAVESVFRALTNTPDNCPAKGYWGTTGPPCSECGNEIRNHRTGLLICECPEGKLAKTKRY